MAILASAGFAQQTPLAGTVAPQNAPHPNPPGEAGLARTGVIVLAEVAMQPVRKEEKPFVRREDPGR